MPEKNSDLDSITQQTLEQNIKTLTNVISIVPIKRGRGRPRKIEKPIEVILDNIDADEEEKNLIKCPKCQYVEPGDWSQCQKICPMPESPWYNSSWLKENNKLSNGLPPNLPPDTWGTWKRFHVSETSAVFLQWIEDCKKIVEIGWEFKIKNIKKFIEITIIQNKTIRPFAFIKKSTGDIHAPCTKKHPFNHFSGNICDKETRLSCMTPLGVKVYYDFLPTSQNYKENFAIESLSNLAINSFIMYDDDTTAQNFEQEDEDDE